MPRPSLLERYFAQCQAHRSPPLPVFVAGLRDGVIDVNLADISLADVRLFSLAVTDTTSAVATGGPQRAASAAGALVSRERRRGDVGGAGGGSAASEASSAASAHGQATTFFSKLHFTYDPTSSARRQQQQQQARPARGGAPAAPPPLLAPQSESTLRCFIDAVAHIVKENASTLRSFAWCGLPIVPPVRGPRSGGVLGARAATLALTQLLPLCKHLTCLRIEGVALSRAQFMQLTMISLSGSSADAKSGSWLELEEASFAGCGLTDSCKGGVVRLIRAGVPMKSAEQWHRSMRSSGSIAGGRSGDPSPTSSPAATISGALSRTRGLRRLDLSDNPIGDETARAIATAITGAALHTLRLADTAVTGKGAALLLLPAVLEENAVELVDLSNTEVSNAYGTAAATSTSSSAELRLLAASSITAGFRVVARGMGQLLVLREAVRTPQQPWNVRTSVTSSSVGVAGAGESPILVPPRAVQRLSASSGRDGSLPPRLRSTGRSASQQEREGEGEEGEGAVSAETDPFSAFIQTHPAPLAAPQATRRSCPSFSQPSTAAPTDRPSSASAAAAAAASSSFPPPPSSAFALPAGGGGYSGGGDGAPWWPNWRAWGPPPSSLTGGKEWLPVPVPVPIPIFTPVQLPYAHAASPQPMTGAYPWPGMPFFPTSTGETSAAPATATSAAPVSTTAPPPPVVPKTSTPDVASLAKTADSPFLQPTTSPPAEAGARAPEGADEEETALSTVADVIDAVGDATKSTTATASAADDAASSRLTRDASETAGGSKFLTALIARLEAHETDVSERMEQQYQRTTTQLTALEKDMRFRLQQLAEAGRKEGAAAAERHAAVLDAITGLREPPIRTAAEAMSEEMLTQLVHLIEVGMTRVQAVLTKGGEVEKRREEKEAAAGSGPPTRASPGAPPLSERDMVKETNQRLKQLGW